MRINMLPEWATKAIVSGPYFGSDDGPEGDPQPAPTTEAPETDPDKESGGNGDVNEEAAKAIRERDALKAERDALAQEKAEREEKEAQARAATRSKEENLEEQVNTLAEENTQLTRVNEINILKIAVLTNKKYDWVDPEDAISLLDRSNIKINAKKGIAEGVEDALKDLAKRKPHLLRAAENSEGNSTGGSGAPSNGIPSGGTPSGSSGGGSKAQKHKAMRERFGSVLGV